MGQKNKKLKFCPVRFTPSLKMGSACSSTPPPPLVTTAIAPVVSPHTPASVNKITPTKVPSKEALMTLFNDYDLDG